MRTTRRRFRIESSMIFSITAPSLPVGSCGRPSSALAAFLPVIGVRDCSCRAAASPRGTWGQWITDSAAATACEGGAPSRRRMTRSLADRKRGPRRLERLSRQPGGFPRDLRGRLPAAGVPSAARASEMPRGGRETAIDASLVRVWSSAAIAGSELQVSSRELVDHREKLLADTPASMALSRHGRRPRPAPRPEPARRHFLSRRRGTSAVALARARFCIEEELPARDHPVPPGATPSVTLDEATSSVS
jgi:hypothetical protein